MHDPAPPFDLSVTDALLSTTRAVRKRLDLDRPVERSVVVDCLRIAVQSPTAGNVQYWRWVIVTDAALKRSIGEIYRAEGMDYLQSGLAAAEDPKQRRVFESALYLAHNLERVPVLVIPCLDHAIDLSSNADAAAIYGSIIPAAWSFQLALRARGLGSAWTTLHLPQEAAVADLLGMPKESTQIALLPVAYTKGLDFKPAARPPVEDIVYWNRWGASDASNS